MKKINLKTKRNKGITLIALIITIIILLILAGVAISTLSGDNGLLKRSSKAADEYERSSVKEELEREIMGLQVETLKKKGELTDKEITDRLKEVKKNLVIISEIAEERIDEIAGEYGNYEFTIDEERNVIIGDKLVGEKPTGNVEILTEEEEAKEVQIKVTATTEDGDIKAIESIDGIKGEKLQKEDNGSSRTFTVTENGIYSFKVIGTNERTCILKTERINNIVKFLDGDSILEVVKGINESGKKKITVAGKTNEEGAEEETITYSMDVIVYDGNLVLDGTKSVLGIEPTKEKVYEFGSEGDVGTASTDAKRTVVLKVNGNLTIDSGVTLTSVKNSAGYGGPKGMIVYCTGTLTNNGTISMTARGGKAVGENVYLWKNTNGTYEYIPAVGADGGPSVSGGTSSGKKGSDGADRQTGGGGSGAAGHVLGSSISGIGAKGTSYSGGSGGGGASGDKKGTARGGNGQENGGAGGRRRQYQWCCRHRRRSRKSRRLA